MSLLWFLGLVFALLYFYAVKLMSFWRSQGIAQPTPNWLLANGLLIFLQKQSISNLIKKLYIGFPNERIVGFYQFAKPILLVRDPKLIKQITIKDFDYFTDHKPVVPEVSDELWNRNLLSLEGKEWRDMRSILSPAYTGNKMKMIYSLMDDCMKNLIKYLQNKRSDVIDVQIKDLTSRFSNDIIATTAFGINVDSLEEPDNQFYLMAKDITDLKSLVKVLKLFIVMLFPKIQEYINFKLFYDPARSFFSNLIKRNLKKRDQMGITRSDMLQLMIEAKKKHFKINSSPDSVKNNSNHLQLTDIDIIANALLFIFGGFESVSSLLTFMSYELAVNPHIQDRLRREIKQVFDDSGEKFSYESLQKMKYLDMVISESLRKFPNFPSTDRLCTKDYTVAPERPGEKPFIIKKGTEVELPLIGFHYDPKYFPDPEQFDPERFNTENKSKIDPYTYFPFGVGQRVCIGNRFALMETKIFFCNLLLNFEIIPNDNTVIPIKLSTKNILTAPASEVCVSFRQL